MKLLDKIAKSDTLVYFSIFLFISINLIDTSFFAEYLRYHVFNVGILAILFCREIPKIRKYRDEKIPILITLLLTLILIISSISFPMAFSSENIPTYLYTLAFIFLLRDVPFEKIAILVLPLTIFWFALIIISSKIGIIEDYILFASDSRVRHYLGFRYALFPSTVLLNIVALYIYVRRNTIKWYEFALLFAAVFWIFQQTVSRLTFLSSVLLLVIAMVIRYFPNLLEKGKGVLIFFIPSYIYGFAFSCIAVFCYNSHLPIFETMNRFLGGRLYLASKSLSQYGFGFFGKVIEWVGNGFEADGVKPAGEYLYVDNLYIQLLQRYGISFILLFIALQTILLLYLYNKREYLLMIILIWFAYHAMIDDLIIKLHYNLFWFLLLVPYTEKNISEYLKMKCSYKRKKDEIEFSG